VHETGLVRDLISRIELEARRGGALRVRSVKVRLGALSHLSPEHFLDHFSIESKGTLAEGARVDVEVSDDASDPGAQGVWLRSLEVEEA
jgi:hydrogenase nickel incorporation protein HypA/HybF